ncbi:MAG: MBL fold metallo-hydrolase [Polyangiaceae bacterium]|jgi:glyoxylase-like metal-dependent hydrolase (beta-lactamase superfamily II)|nr:MBL fold metallo-hydrolase [Polyangiaceae bacterium]
MKPQIETFYDPATFTLTYLVFDPQSRDAVVIDPVLDYDPLASQTDTSSTDKLIAFVKSKELRLQWILETHAHADHLSSSQYLKNQLGAKVAIGERIREVQVTFKGVFDLPTSFRTDGSQFDRLLADGEVLQVGAMRIEVIATPGHTPACVSYKIDDAVFTGDALFMDDYGTGRCDFPKGSAAELYTSIHDRLYKLPEETRVFVGHDYQPNGRELKFETTIGASKKGNIQLRHDTPQEEFVAFRQRRDATLKQPRLLFPSVQVNIDAGRLPQTHENGIRYLRMPLNLKKPTRDDGSSA